jgi:hypothetical protein
MNRSIRRLLAVTLLCTAPAAAAPRDSATEMGLRAATCCCETACACSATASCGCTVRSSGAPRAGDPGAVTAMFQALRAPADLITRGPRCPPVTGSDEWLASALPRARHLDAGLLRSVILQV